MSITRRDLLVGSAGMAAGAAVSVPFLLPKYHFDRRPKRSRVAILNVERYSPPLEQSLESALRLFPIDSEVKLLSSSLISLIIFPAMQLIRIPRWLLRQPNASCD
jgi:hypothetical protein